VVVVVVDCGGGGVWENGFCCFGCGSECESEKYSADNKFSFLFKCILI